MKYSSWIWRNTQGIRLNTAVRIVTGTAQVALGLMMVWLSRRFIDETIRTGTTRDVITMVCWLVLTVVGGVLLRQVYYLLTTKAGIHQTNTLRLRIFSSLFRRQLYDDKEMHSGDVSSRLTKDIELVSDTTTDTLPQMCITAIQLVGAFLLLHYFDRWLAWALLIMTPLAILMAKFIGRRLRQMTLDIRQDESRIQMQVQEGMENNAVLRAMGSQEWMTGRLDSAQQQLKGNIMHRTRFTIMIRIILGSAFGLGYLLAFVWGGLQLRNGAITFGIMTSFLQLVGQIQHPVMQLLNLVPQVIHSTASIDRLHELETLETGPDASTLHPTLSGIQFNNVSFKYAGGDRQILSAFTHDFRPGSKTALMGETGIGKTTLFRLMLGFISPQSGSISLYGTDGITMSVGAQTRPDFVFVPQGNTLMSGSIRFNLQVANPDASDQELIQALHTACADFVMDLPDGLDTQLGERGSGLSEGQAQRIAIARGLLRPGSILLLDEISSSLDPETEAELYSRLFRSYPQKTMIFITHRKAVTNLCDSVISL
ncbi:MAG: ABC transporter ATP-binding protein/permease [Bacteroidaceae bacterium]|nr:ABC transporter ATP-binding protein/permease [Bacteroidaceae bacterium]